MTPPAAKGDNPLWKPCLFLSEQRKCHNIKVELLQPAFHFFPPRRILRNDSPLYLAGNHLHPFSIMHDGKKRPVQQASTRERSLPFFPYHEITREFNHAQMGNNIFDYRCCRGHIRIHRHLKRSGFSRANHLRRRHSRVSCVFGHAPAWLRSACALTGLEH